MNKTKQLVIDAILLALLIISSKIVIPMGTVGITLQVLVLLIIALLNNLKDSMIITITYLVLGFVFQLPVFAFGGGISYLYNPSTGFLIGFIPAILLIKFLMKVLKLKNTFIKSMISTVIGILVIYIVAILYGVIIYSNNTNTLNVLEIIELLILPYIVFDLFKATIASVIYSRLRHIF